MAEYKVIELPMLKGPKKYVVRKYVLFGLVGGKYYDKYSVSIDRSHNHIRNTEPFTNLDEAIELADKLNNIKGPRIVKVGEAKLEKLIDPK